MFRGTRRPCQPGGGYLVWCHRLQRGTPTLLLLLLLRWPCSQRVVCCLRRVPLRAQRQSTWPVVGQIRVQTLFLPAAAGSTDHCTAAAAEAAAGVGSEDITELPASPTLAAAAAAADSQPPAQQPAQTAREWFQMQVNARSPAALVTCSLPHLRPSLSSPASRSRLASVPSPVSSLVARRSRLALARANSRTADPVGPGNSPVRGRPAVPDPQPSRPDQESTEGWRRGGSGGGGGRAVRWLWVPVGGCARRTVAVSGPGLQFRTPAAVTTR